MILAALAWADPAELAPGATELLAAEKQLDGLLGTARATGEATARLQTAWTRIPAPKLLCGVADAQARAAAAQAANATATAIAARPAEPPGSSTVPAEPVAEDPALTRLELGWRIERFGSAWRDASQSVRAQADRVRRYRAAATVAPLVDARWTAALDALLARAERNERAFLEASAWEVLYVRPALAACPAIDPTPRPGIAMLEVRVRGEDPAPTAILALGDGWVCTPAERRGRRADDAVVLVAGEACWSASPTCGCTPEPVEPGAILGPTR